MIIKNTPEQLRRLQIIWNRIIQVGPETQPFIGIFNNPKGKKAQCIFIADLKEVFELKASAGYKSADRAIFVDEKLSDDESLHRLVHEGTHCLQDVAVPACFSFNRFSPNNITDTFFAEAQNLFITPADYIGVMVLLERLALAAQIQVAMSLAEKGDEGPIVSFENSKNITPGSYRSVLQRCAGLHKNSAAYRSTIRQFGAVQMFERLGRVRIYQDIALKNLEKAAEQVQKGELPPIPVENYVRMDHEGAMKLADASGLNFWRLSIPKTPDIMSDIKPAAYDKKTRERIREINQVLGVPARGKISMLTPAMEAR